MVIDKSIKSMSTHHNKFIMTGQQNSGKSSIIKQIKLDSFSEEFLQNGYSFDSIRYENLSILCLSLDGEWKIRQYQEKFFQNKDAIIYVLDSDNEDSIKQAIFTIDKILFMNFDANLPVLILYNKYDIQSLKGYQIKERLSFENQHKISQIRVQELYSLDKDGIHEGFQWLDQACNSV